MFADLPKYSLTGNLQSPLQIPWCRNVRYDLPMSNAARKQLGIQLKVVRNTDALPTHDLHVSQHVMFEDFTSKHWYPAVIESLCPEPRSYKITTSDGIIYRKTQSFWSLLHLRTRTYNLLSVCHWRWCNLSICDQWNLNSRRRHKWTGKCKYRQADLKGTLSPSQAWSLSTLKCLICEYLYTYNV